MYAFYIFVKHLVEFFCLFYLFSIFRKFIEIDIVDDEDYQKNESFFIELGQPITELNEKNGNLND